MQNGFIISRGTCVARKATWQRHADPRGAYATHHILIYLYSFIIYIGISAFRISEGYSTVRLFASYKLDSSF